MCQLVTEPGILLTVAVFSAIPSETGASARGFCGGYPSLGTVTYFYNNTNMRELIDKQLPYPSDFVEARQMHKEGTLKAENVRFYPGDSPNVLCKDGDLFIIGAHAENGWGDVLEREYPKIEEDLQYGWLSPEVVEKIYGAVSDGNGKIDIEKSEALRKEMRKIREEKSVDASEWWKEERQKVLNKDFGPDVFSMFADGMKYEKFRRRQIDIWQLPEDYQL